MSDEIWLPELEELKDLPVLEGELEWVASVIDAENCSKPSNCYQSKTGCDGQG